MSESIPEQRIGSDCGRAFAVNDFSGKRNGNVIIMLISYLASDAGGSSGGSSSGLSGEPWKELGVSEKEYMEIYNYYKHGVNFGN